MLKFQKRILLLFLLVFQASVTVALADPPTAEPGNIDGDIFGKRSKWYQVFLSLHQAYDDNIFNTNEDREDDFITAVSPGLQVTIPEFDQPAEEIVSNTAVAGGRVFGRLRPTSFRRFQAYARYAPRIRSYSRNKDENMVNHHAQAGLQLNFTSGLSFDAADHYVEGFDQLQADISPKTDRYYSNLFTFTAGYPIFGKCLLRVDYTNFQVTYSDDEKNGFGNRADNSGTGYLFFKIMPKTALYLKYQHTDIDYENDIRRNGAARDILGGFKWDFGPKTGVNFQAGYGKRSYRDSFFDDGNSFVYQVNVDYLFSSKTNFGIMAFRRNEEPSESVYSHARTTGLSLKFSQSLTPKVMIACDTSYHRYEYNGGESERIEDSERINDHVIFTPSINYAFRKWLSLSLLYTHRQRNSDIDDDSYFGNIIAIKITGAI